MQNLNQAHSKEAMKQKVLRSTKWFEKKGKDGLIYRSWLKNQGIPAHFFKGKPVIGICNTWSELTPCNGHFRELALEVKKGIIEAGGFPLEFPVMSLGETLMKPTAMLFRNLASMDVEESIRANPLDGVVLLCGCDKTTPSLLMGAASVDLPAIVVSGGPMLIGRHRGLQLGTTDVWRFSDAERAGIMSEKEIEDAEAGLCRSNGHCGVMGTASTMACMVEALGMSLPENAAIPAADSRRKTLAYMTGMYMVDMVKQDIKPSDILTRKAFENAIKINMAVGGSTNFLIHILAIAGRVGIDLSLRDIETVGSEVPLLVNLQPSGKYFMEDFYYAGGLPAVIKELLPLLHKEVLHANGKTLENNYSKSGNFNRDVIFSLASPLQKEAAIVVLSGNLCEHGAVIKQSAASPRLMVHRGKAFVFENIEEFKNKIDDEDLPITENDIMVLKNVGPVGYPGMAEVGNMAIPAALLKRGITDMVRISDGRMSGTAFGTVVLHISPEAAIGGTLAIVQTGDEILLDVPNKTLELLLPEEEIRRRKDLLVPFPLHSERGYINLYQKHVQQAHLGADLDFLRGKSTNIVLRDSH